MKLTHNFQFGRIEERVEGRSICGHLTAVPAHGLRLHCIQHDVALVREVLLLPGVSSGGKVAMVMGAAIKWEDNKRRHD